MLCLGLAAPSSAQAPGNCATGQAQAFLDVNEVRASVFNTGGLAYGGTTTSGEGYLVPKETGKTPLFAAGLWVGGKVDGELRFAGARYGNWNFWPGPLDDGARPVNPDDCSAFDRIFSVTRADIDAYEAGSPPSADLADWPVDLGAPVIDGDGDETNYSLVDGDRPDIVGDQGVWWVMNDVGNVHLGVRTDPIGLEVAVLAYAFARADALGTTTFYRYTLKNKSAFRLDTAYASIFADPDLGFGSDDYVGSDSLLSLAFVYNADDADETPSGYGLPPAFGFDILTGPAVAGVPLGASAVFHLRNVYGPINYDPSEPIFSYRHQQGMWIDGSPMRIQGNGYQQPTSSPITRFVYNGDPVVGEGWTELNPGPGLPPETPGDRRFLLTTGPFTIEPGESQQITMAMIFAQGTDHLDSVTELKRADRLVQSAFDNGFLFGIAPPPPSICDGESPGSGTCAEAIAGDRQLDLVWGYPAESSNYLGRFSEVDPLLSESVGQDSTYDFEGFNVYAYPNRYRIERERTLIATFDKVNGVTEIRDEVYNPEIGGVRPAIVMRGSDNALHYSLTVDGLSNHSDYHYAITAYSYNGESTPKVVESAPTFISGRPERLPSGAAERSKAGDPLQVATVARAGAGDVRADVAAPRSISSATYEVRFHHPTDATGSDIDSLTTFSVTNTTSGATVMDGQAFHEATGEAHPTGGVIRVIDGFQLIVEPGAVAGDVYRIDTADAAPLPATAETRAASLDDIQIVPNPYLGRSGYDLGADSRVARITNLPDAEVTVRIFTVGGTLVNTLVKPAGTPRYIDWDLTTQTGRPAASGMYLIQIAAEGVGERVLKFGLVQGSEATR